MPESTLSIGHTCAYRGERIRKWLLGAPGLLIAFFIIAGAFALSYVTNNFNIGLAASLLVLSSLHIIHVFVQEMLHDCSGKAHAIEGSAGMLSIALLQELYPKKVVTSGDILDACLSTPRGTFVLKEMNVTKEQVLSQCKKEVAEEVDPATLIQELSSHLHEKSIYRIDSIDILSALFAYIPSCKKVLQSVDLSEEEFKGLLKWEEFHHTFDLKEHPLSPSAIARNASLGRSWVMGYTNALDIMTSEYSTEEVGAGEGSIIINNRTIDTVVNLLSSGRQKNILLMGKVGTGKRSLIKHVAIALRKAERQRNVPFTRIVELHVEQLLSGIQRNDSFLLEALQKAQQAGNFVIVIRNFAALLQSENSNLKTVLMKALESKNLNVIAIADLQDYHSIIKQNAALDSMFETVTLDDSSDEDTMRVLMAHYFTLEKRHIHVSYKALQSVLQLSKRYVQKGGLPGKAIDILDETMMRVAESGRNSVTEADVRDVVSVKGKVNVSQLNDTEKTRLINLESALKSRVIGQDSAIKALSSSLKRARMELGERKRPVGTFLFLGPTGVGKTETAKALAMEYFGSADSMIRMDMNEYSHPDSVFSVIGRPDGTEGFLTQRVQDKPFSLILLDEIEKAHQSVLNLFLQILDEGSLIDGKGMKTDFKNTIIIATSNAGALFIRDFIKERQEFDKAHFKKELLDEIIKQKLYSPEFLNRFDDVVVYYPLTKEDAKKVAMLMIGSFLGEIEKSRGIMVTVDSALLEALVEHGYSIEFGAREMRRTITGKIEDYLADYFLTHDVKRGDTIAITSNDVSW